MRSAQLVRLVISAMTLFWLGCPGGTGGPTGADGGVTGDGSTAVVYEKIFETEHADAITVLSQTPDRLLSIDQLSHYNLWNVHSKISLVNGSTKSAASLSGNVFVVQPLDFEVRDATDGRLLFSIPTAMAAKAAVASDGSYVWSASSTGFQVFSVTGAGLFSVSGDYSHAVVFAAPGEARIANGGKGTNVIELLAVPAGTSTTSPPLQGKFQSWFADGSQLLTLSGDVLHAYTRTGAAGGVFSVSGRNFGGIGDFVWFMPKLGTSPPSYLELYPASGSTLPTASFNVTGFAGIVPTGSGLGILYLRLPAVDIITFPAGKPTATRVATDLPQLVTFARDAGGTWSVGGSSGVVYYGDPLNAAASGRLGYGRMSGIGSTGAAGTAAIIAVGFPFKTLAFDLSTMPARQLTTIDFGSSKLKLSRDGSVLAAWVASYVLNSTDGAAKTFSLPLGTELHSWPITLPNYLEDIQLAAGGSRLALILANLNESHVYERHITDPSGTVHDLDDTGSASNTLRLSPDGSEYADVIDAFSWASATKIYRHGALINGIDGTAAGWIDDGQLLIASIRTQGRLLNLCTGSTVYDPAGNVLSMAPLPCIYSFDYIPPDRAYSHDSDTIFDLKTGRAVWKGPVWTAGMPQEGIVAGDSVVYIQGREIRRVKYL